MKKVLLADIDSQTHLTNWLDFTVDGKPTIAELIYQTAAQFPVHHDDFIRHNEKLNLDCIPATPMLTGAVATLHADQTDKTTVFTRIFSDNYFEGTSKNIQLPIDTNLSQHILAKTPRYTSV